MDYEKRNNKKKIVFIITMLIFSMAAFTQIQKEKIYGKYKIISKENHLGMKINFDFILELNEEGKYELKGYMSIPEEEVNNELVYKENGVWKKIKNDIIFSGEKASELDDVKNSWIETKKCEMIKLKIRERNGKIYLKNMLEKWNKIEE